MQFFKFSALTVFLAFCLFISNAMAADVAKIGIVDFQKVLTTSDAGKDAQQKITEKGNKMKAALEAKGKAIDEARSKYERESAVMSSDARAAKERELQIDALDFKDLKTQYESEFKAYNQQLVNQFRTDVTNIVDQIGKKQGYMLILEKNQSGAIYVPAAIDITDEVIRKYNALYKKRTNEQTHN